MRKNIPTRFKRNFYGNITKNVIITTSRRPSNRSRTFVKELSSIIPNSIRLTRGHLSLKNINEICLNYNIESIVIVYDSNGNPSKIVALKPSMDSEKPEYIFSLRIKGVSLRKEIGLQPKLGFVGSALYIDGKENLLVNIAQKISATFKIDIIKDQHVPKKFSIIKLSINKNEILLEGMNNTFSRIGPIVRFYRDDIDA